MEIDCKLVLTVSNGSAVGLDKNRTFNKFVIVTFDFLSNIGVEGIIEYNGLNKKSLVHTLFLFQSYLGVHSCCSLNLHLSKTSGKKETQLASLHILIIFGLSPVNLCWWHGLKMIETKDNSVLQGL